ncbi:hypothetical protein CAPN001_13480 [Capnocytophaga stomatis]|uniref:hypothetical protein n=1 Tax=Capnocytophaga stomatis TaxID=1848904 RepID=UPI0019520502|nr:hypothetical protein [Capnocytophaga stomatis]GIJ96779.1 hypothetical protein CAPN001_13480 [Capnocytophaga stomatis]GIM48594.1 hypothetical protein CAPN003_00460 [Capnocytophaga stomatis]
MKSMTSLRIGNVYIYDTDAFSQQEKDFCSKMYSVIYFADFFCKNGISKVIRPLNLFLTNNKDENGQRFEWGVKLWVDVEKLKNTPDKLFPKEAILAVRQSLIDIAPMHDWTKENIELNFGKVLEINLQGQWAVTKNITHKETKFQFVMQYDGNKIISNPTDYMRFLMKIKPPKQKAILVPVSLKGSVSAGILVPSMVTDFSFKGDILTLKISNTQIKKWKVDFGKSITLTDI